MKSIVKSKNFVIYTLLAMMLVVNFSHRIWSASRNAYSDDEGLSILAAKGITEHGIPVFRSGKLYFRSMLGHYLLAIPIYLFGINDFSTRSISIILSMLLLLLVFATACNIDNKHTGLLAVLFLTFSKIENLYSVSPRFYMTFEFFFILTLFLFYKGFIEKDNNKYKLCCIVSFLGAIFSHRLSIELIPIFLLSLMIIKKGKWFKDKYLLGGMVLTGCAYWIVLFYSSSRMFTPFAASALGGLKIGAMKSSLGYFNLLDKLNPNSLPIVFLGILYVYFERDKRAFFYYLSFFVGMIIVSLISPIGNFRYISNLNPLYIILLSYSLTKIAKSIYNNFGNLINKSSINKAIFIPIILISLSIFTFRMAKMTSFFSFGYTPRRVKETYLFVKENIRDDDILISNNPWVTELYIRASDYFLSQRRVGGKWVKWDFEVDTKGYGYRLLGSIPKLQSLLNTEKRRVWVLVDDIKINLFTGREIISFINQSFDIVYNPDTVTAYLFESKDSL